MVTLFAVLLRGSCALAGAAAALATLGPPVRPGVLAATLLLLTGWSVLFAGWAARAGLLPALVGVDLALTLAVCLAIRHLVPPAALPGQVSWVAILASTSVVVAQLAWPAVASVPAGLVLAAGYLVGAGWAGDPAEGTAHAVTLVVQTGSGAMLMLLVRRAGRSADSALAAVHEDRRRAILERSQRAQERRLNRDLHDTALSTLTMVGLGAVTGSEALRARAAADLAAVEALAPRTPAAPTTGLPGTAATGLPGTPATGPLATGLPEGLADPEAPAPGEHPAPVPPRPDEPEPADWCRLDERLAAVPLRFPQVQVDLELAGCRVPRQVADALTASAAEALANVARHAGTDKARLSLHRTGRTVRVEITDRGAGFDPALVPTHRYGLRESVRGRMAAVAGRATVESAPGQGTRVRLEWSP